jgi:hypothetical protein
MKTAVEWLIEKLLEKGLIKETVKSGYYLAKCLDEANKMFEEQVTLSHINGQSEFDKGAISENTKKLATEYYNQTFKSEE